MTGPNESGWVPGTVENDVLFGRKEHLFLAQGFHRSMDLATGSLTVPDVSIENFKSNITHRAEIASRYNAKYMHIIFADKQSVLKEEYPLDEILQISELYRAKSAELSELVFYTADALNVKDLVFKRTDTHLTDFGTLLVTIDLLKRLGFEVPSDVVRSMFDNAFQEVTYSGDLGGRFDPPLSSKELVFTKPQRVAWWHNDLQGGNNGIVDIRYAPDALFNKRVMFFGDSFGRDCVRFLSLFFTQTVFLRTPFCHEELVHLYKPDILITENVERYLDNVQLDESRDLFLMMPYLSQLDYKPSLDFARAFSAEFSFGLEKYKAYIEAMTQQFAG